MNSKRIWYKGILVLMIVFLIIVFVIYKMQQNVSYEHQERTLGMVETATLAAAPRLEQRAKCLLLWDDSADGIAGRDTMEDVFGEMRVAYDCVQAVQTAAYDITAYDKVVLCMNNMDVMGEGIPDLIDWVKDGGKLMFAFLPVGSVYFPMFHDCLGIKATSNERRLVNTLHFTRPLMPGGEARDYHILEPYDSSLEVMLDGESVVYLESNGERPIPLIWQRAYGGGAVVAANLGFLEKTYRGFYCAAYSLLGDAFAWPVINGSTFYLDDFPSPIPMGDGEFISRDYGMSIDNFMRSVWWEDVRAMTEKYGIRFTGMVIEDYSDQVSGEFPANGNFTRYQYFGNMLLDAGGEIGFHGYNHMPLVLSNFDYQNEYGSYRPWQDTASMKSSLTELNRFCESLYPQETFQVYVPPSNILSEEGRRLIAAEFPYIRAIASSYLEDTAVYVQEFEVADDGIVETPRIISGCEMNEYSRLSALAELTMHYVNTHFMHPDDTLDVDRGAELGWAELYARLTEYADWLYAAAPGIRNLTGSELAAAVQRYDALQVEQRIEDGTLMLELGGFVDEAYLLVRLNGKTPGDVSGGALSKLMDTLYLLRADEAKVTIALNGQSPEAVK